jgi:hypothetical protein
VGEDHDTWYSLEWSKRMSEVSIIGERMIDGVGNIWRKSAFVLLSACQSIFFEMSLGSRIAVVVGFAIRWREAT